jgi:hypothetical protein
MSAQRNTMATPDSLEYVFVLLFRILLRID